MAAGALPRRSLSGVLVAGAIAAGKTTVAELLAHDIDADLVKVRVALAEVLRISERDRTQLQERGADLDKRTNGRWLLEYLELQLEQSNSSVVVDSLRTKRQTIPILEHHPSMYLVYLDARLATRSARFNESRGLDPVKSSMAFAEAMRHPTETGVTQLRDMAHLVIDTDDLSPQAVVAEVRGR